MTNSGIAKQEHPIQGQKASCRIAFIDTEVGIDSQKVQDYGAVREDDAVLHTQSAQEFEAFLSGCGFVCGHNIIKHDLKYLKLKEDFIAIDTLPLSPLLFPRKPYHRLLKDDKLLIDELNNPVNDAKKARDLFFDEVEAWKALSVNRQTIYRKLLEHAPEFHGFFEWIGGNCENDSADVSALIREDFSGKICIKANIEAVVKHYPIELAFALAVIGADDLQSLTPAWVLRNYPKVNNVMTFLCFTPCGECEYCKNKLDAHAGLKELFGFFEYLHPFRDGNGRTGRLLSNWILLHADHPMVIIDVADRAAYINALRQIRAEGTDEFLISFFFQSAITRMEKELAQKRRNTNLGLFLF